MIDLYALTSPNVQKIFIALEELELPYNTILVDVWKGEHYKPEFRKLNPNGKIPVIVDHDGPGGKPYTVFESGAILMYLGDKTGRLFPRETRARYDVIQWLMIQLTGIGPNFGQLTHFRRFAGPGNDYALSRFQTEVRRLYDVLERRLGEAPYLGGAEYSIADIATFPWCRNHDFHKVSFDDHPNVARWFDALAARPAVKRALEKVDRIPTSRDSAKPEDLDRLFGRGAFARP
ncbi:MAG: glutathione S-transferase N-terminal domain-containing protein [Variibacter sp.]|nr:glutathione S-transferase N-terminal domain-containing protein [Variibacter sp.]